ncbi:hypothetical protein ACQR5U_02715 [Xanthomonas oryzae pv. oryzicola]|uniref:hypothetical protein n=1 Tax=Xanthomonas oryzae TaxID=347 RepID=UPI000B40758E|nr:hypothetical protein [Xanthomonas oryzae]OWB28830.1 hypothetical protein XocBAI20_12150 [Xanthomonas oryzae pv. oryzicola]
MGASTVWRKTFSILSIVVGIWMIVIWRWRQTNYLPSATDLTVYGLGLPTTALIGIGVLRAAFSRVPSASASVVPEPAPVATGAANSTEQHPAEAMTALVLDSALQLPAGRSVDDIMVSVRKGDLVGLHGSLRSIDGTHLFAAAVPTLKPQRFVSDQVDLEEEQIRALLLAADVVDELMPRQATQQVGADIIQAPVRAGLLNIHLLLPVRWQDQQATMTAWWEAHLAAQEWTSMIASSRVRLVVDASDALARIDEVVVALNEARSSDRQIVIACDSWLGELSALRLGAREALYGRGQLNGRVLGEGACGLVLGGMWAHSSPIAVMHRPVSAQRSFSIDAAPLRRESTLKEVVERACAQRPALEMAQCALVSNVDQRASRRTEAAGVAEHWWPEGDADAHCVHLGLANGQSEAVLALSALIVASRQAKAQQHPVIAVSTSDPVSRSAVLIEAASEQQDADASGQAA